MGCSSSNTLESNESVANEKNALKDYHKTVENEKYLDEQCENLFSKACEMVNNENEITKMLEELNQKYKNVNLSHEEQVAATYYRVACKSLENEDNIQSMTNSASHLKELLSFTEESLIKPLGDIFIENTGSTLNFLINSCESYLYKTSLQILKYDDKYAKYDTFIFLISGSAIESEEIYRLIGSFAKSHRNIRNLIIGVSDEENKVKFSNGDNFSYIFDGIALSKSIKNFSVFILESTNINFSVKSKERILDSISKCSLNSLGFVNFGFSEFDDNIRLCEAISKNSNFTLVGLQFNNIPSIEKEVSAIANAFSYSKTLKGLIIGAQISDPLRLAKNEEEMIQRKNPNFKRLLIDHFKMEN